jgi:hypothetical protein
MTNDPDERAEVAFWIIWLLACLCLLTLTGVFT